MGLNKHLALLGVTMILNKDKTNNMSIIQGLLKIAMCEIMANPMLKKFPFNVFENGTVVLYQSVKGENAKEKARRIASHYWKCIQNRLEDKDAYYIVACTWIDDTNTQHSQKVDSFDFGHQAGSIKPHHKTFEIPKSTTRGT